LKDAHQIADKDVHLATLARLPQLLAAVHILCICFRTLTPLVPYTAALIAIVQAHIVTIHAAIATTCVSTKIPASFHQKSTFSSHISHNPIP
jgi:hypothetical protein